MFRRAFSFAKRLFVRSGRRPLFGNSVVFFLPEEKVGPRLLEEARKTGCKIYFPEPIEEKQ